MAEDRYVFLVEWFDSAAALVRNYQLTYFLKDKSIEMVLMLLVSMTSRISVFSSSVVSTHSSS